jgi:lysophospholipase L1-like esterase
MLSCRPVSALSRLITVLALVPFAACGGGGNGSPNSPSSPPPSPGTPVAGFVFYDQNGNGSVDSGEEVRFPAVTVLIASRSGQSTARGHVVVNDVPAGAQAASLRQDTLPAFFRAGSAVPVQVPQAAGSEVAIPAVLSIGGNRPNVYMAFGDSISAGDGSSDGGGYRGYLEADLRSYWGQAQVVNEGIAGTRSDRGADRMGGSLSRARPAYSLILYGTNDWNQLVCKNAFPCFTLDSIRSMIGQAKSVNSLPVVGTIIPGNPAISTLVPPDRNEWIARMNDLIRPMARQEGAVVADLHAAFLREPSLPPLFDDHIHPNDRGYQVIAREFFRAITQPQPPAQP